MSQTQYVSNNNESLIIKPPPDLAVAYLAKFTKSLSFQVYISKVENLLTIPSDPQAVQ